MSLRFEGSLGEVQAWRLPGPLLKGPSMLLMTDDPQETAAARTALEAAWPGVWMVAVSDGAQARAWLEAALAQTWQLVTVDLHTCPDSGLALIAELAERHPSLPILAIAAEDDRHRAIRALCAGAQGCVLKPLDGDELVRAVRQMLRGEAPVTPKLTGLLLTALRQAMGTGPMPFAASDVRPAP